MTHRALTGPHQPAVPDRPARQAQLLGAYGGTAWRCLRCGDFALGAPHGAGAADRAPLVPRGKGLRDVFVLRFLAVERAVRGVFIVLVALAVWRFGNSKDAVRRLFDEYLDVLAVLYILLAKRLFGLRGGHGAFEQERHGASLLEVEETATVGARA
ncbi:hypothetical protein [Streptomyces lincolnensis]|uniref:hypothetical protein n=1 Tax=Streptomyces lincolnensis TaxID=1915 RepID=UPI0037D6EF23